jgi:hypothetical protein
VERFNLDMNRILEALDEGKKVRVVKTWTGTHVLGDRYYDNENILIEIDDETVFDKDFPSDQYDLDDVDEMFNELTNKIYEKAYDKALELLVDHLGLSLEEFKELEEKGEIEIFADEEGNIICRNEKKYAVVFTEYHQFDTAGKHIKTYIYFKPQLMPMK